MPRSLRFWSRISNEAIPNPRRVGDGLAARTARREGVLENGACDGPYPLMSYSSSYLSAYSQFRRPSSIQASDDGRGRVHVLRHLVPVLACPQRRDDGELAVVDGAVATAAPEPSPARGTCCPHSSAPMRRPHARASVADDQEVALVVPALPAATPATRLRPTSSRASAAEPATAAAATPAPSETNGATAHPCSFVLIASPFSLHCFGFALNGRRLRLPYAGCVRLPSSSAPFFPFVGEIGRCGSIGAEPLGRSIRYAMKRGRLLYCGHRGTVPHRAREAGFDERGSNGGRVCGTSSRHFALTGNR